MSLLAAFASVAVINAIGLWGGIACGSPADARDRHPPGARCAALNVARVVVGGSLKVTLLGAALGSSGALGVSRLLGALLFG
jgi:hypothetical protein